MRKYWVRGSFRFKRLRPTAIQWCTSQLGLLTIRNFLLKIITVNAQLIWFESDTTIACLNYDSCGSEKNIKQRLFCHIMTWNMHHSYTVGMQRVVIVLWERELRYLCCADNIVIRHQPAYRHIPPYREARFLLWRWLVSVWDGILPVKWKLIIRLDLKSL